MQIKSVIIMSFFFSLFFLGCASTSIKYLNPEKFMLMNGAITNDTSICETTYIGASNTRIYMEFSEMGILNGKHVIYWTDLDKIPNTFINTLQIKRQEKDKLIEYNKKIREGKIEPFPRQ